MTGKLRVQWQVAGLAAQTVVRTESVAQWWGVDVAAERTRARVG